VTATIDEDRLRALLEIAATEAPPPMPEAAEVIAAFMVDAPPPDAPARDVPARRWAIALPALALVVAIVVGATFLLNGRDTGLSNRLTRLAPTGGSVSDAANETQAYDRLGEESASASGAGRGAAGTDGAKIVKTGSVELEVAEHRFDLTVERLAALATGLGGYVARSETSESARVPHGTVTLRIPEGSFDEVVGRVRRMGKVHALTSQARDVTAEYTDRENRLRALTAERDALLTILADARTIPDILAVRDRSTRVQTEIEQLQGQQRLLDDQASLATLAVTVAEPGRGGFDPVDTERSGLSGAWHDAVDRFVGGVEAIVAASGTVVLVLLCLVAVGLATRPAWRYARRRMV
jgi:hypothetical protein